MTAGVKKKQRRRYRPESDSVTARFISDSSDDSDFEVRIPHVKYSDYKKKNKGCTSTEKSLCAVIIVCIIISIVLSVLLVTQFVLNVGSFRKQTCMRPDCVEVAGAVLSKMDLSADPCDDFYQYVCGRWLEELVMPPDKSRYSIFTEVADRNQARVRKLLVQPGHELQGENSTAVRKVKDYFTACMDTAGIEKRGIQPVMKLIKDVGSWPLTTGESGTWVEGDWVQLDALVAIHLLAVSPLFDMSVSENLKNVDEHIITFDQSGLTFADRSFYLNDSVAPRYFNAFRDYFSSIAVLLGAENSTAYQAAEDIWNLEKQIANITKPPEERQDSEKLYHKMHISDLQRQMGDWIDLKTYLEKMFGHPRSTQTDIVVYAPEFLSQIGDIVAKTSKSTLANYFVWHAISPFLNYLPYEFKQAQLRMKTALTGATALEEDWKRCIKVASGALSQASGAIFVEKYFSEDDKQKVTSILHSVKAQLRAQMPDVAWMDEETKQRAIIKVDALGDMVGYPEMAKDAVKLDAYYEELQVSPDNIFESRINLLRYTVQKMLRKLSKKPDRAEWHMSPADVNAYYSMTTNQMVLPAGILQAPFYDPRFPMALNFGAIGMVIGHELTHGFDNMGRQYDEYGNLKNWWNKASADAFHERTQCLIHQYSQFTVGKMKVNGRFTQGENIADNGGLGTAFRAFQKWQRDHSSESDSGRLPSLNMSDFQMYFTGFGQFWCESATPKTAQQMLATNPHSPSRYRVIGSAQNSEDFSSAFKCPSESPMNPRKKCTVW